MMPTGPGSSALRRALVSLGGAGVLVAGTAWRAWQLEPMPRGVRALPVTYPVVAPPDTGAPDMVFAAVDSDPFAVRLAETDTAADTTLSAVDDGKPQEPNLQLIGTVVSTDGASFAMCQRSGERPKMVRVGGTIGDFTLTQVTPGTAVFVSASGATIELQARRAGS